MVTFAIIALSIARVAYASAREAVVVPVGPKKNRTESERQCVRQRIEAIVDSRGGNFTAVRACRVHPTHWLISTQVAGKKLYHPVKCAADAKLGALARGMAQGHNSMETMSTPRQDMLVGALEGFLEDLPSS